MPDPLQSYEVLSSVPIPEDREQDRHGASRGALAHALQRRHCGPRSSDNPQNLNPPAHARTRARAHARPRPPVERGMPPDPDAAHRAPVREASATPASSTFAGTPPFPPCCRRSLPAGRALPTHPTADPGGPADASCARCGPATRPIRTTSAAGAEIFLVHCACRQDQQQRLVPCRGCCMGRDEWSLP